MTVPAIAVRVCTPDDLPAIEATEPVGKDYARSALRRQDSGAATYLVAWRGVVPVGSAEVVFGDRPELQNLAVRAGFRGAGIGTALIDAAEDLVRDGGVLLIGVSDDNPRARDLYLRRGYVPTAEIETYTYTYVDDTGLAHTVTETAEYLAKPL